MTKPLWLSSLLLIAAACSSPPPTGPREICGNGMDDDGNGKADCDDVECAGQNGCPGPAIDAGFDGGSCAKCGTVCSAQKSCLAESFDRDRPLPQCSASRCVQFAEAVQLRLQVDTSAWSGFPQQIRSINTRFVSRTQVDGGALDCQGLKALAADKTDAGQIEGSGAVNLRGFDVAPATLTGGATFVQPFVNVTTGKDFMVWMEFWGGGRDTVTGLPTGNRYGFGCFETGPEVAEILPSHDCSGSDGGAATGCRTVRLAMPGPQ